MSSLIFTLFVLALLFRLGSLFLSIRHEKKLKADGAVEYGARTSTLLAGAHVLFYVGTLAEGLWRRTQPSPWTSVGLLLYIFSVVALIFVWRELKDLWTVKLIIAPNHRLNLSNLFRWVRHPNYFLNIVPELVGLALIMGAWIVLFVGLPLYLVVLWRRIAEEERVMKEHFPHY